jgi:hypothetical protein
MEAVAPEESAADDLPEPEVIKIPDASVRGAIREATGTPVPLDIPIIPVSESISYVHIESEGKVHIVNRTSNGDLQTTSFDADSVGKNADGSTEFFQDDTSLAKINSEGELELMLTIENPTVVPVAAPDAPVDSGDDQEDPIEVEKEQSQAIENMLSISNNTLEEEDRYYMTAINDKTGNIVQVDFLTYPGISSELDQLQFSVKNQEELAQFTKFIVNNLNLGTEIPGTEKIGTPMNAFNPNAGLNGGYEEVSNETLQQITNINVVITSKSNRPNDLDNINVATALKMGSTGKEALFSYAYDPTKPTELNLIYYTIPEKHNTANILLDFVFSLLSLTEHDYSTFTDKGRFGITYLLSNNPELQEIYESFIDVNYSMFEDDFYTILEPVK